jgi:mannitol-1-phosphate/altronate dehydrogenase
MRATKDPQTNLISEWDLLQLKPLKHVGVIFPFLYSSFKLQPYLFTYLNSEGVDSTGRFNTDSIQRLRKQWWAYKLGFILEIWSRETFCRHAIDKISPAGTKSQDWDFAARQLSSRVVYESHTAYDWAISEPSVNVYLDGSLNFLLADAPLTSRRFSFESCRRLVKSARK